MTLQQKIKSNPVAASIISTLVLSALWASATFFLVGLFEQREAPMLLLLRSAINIVFTVLAVILLGVINQTDGFKHVLRTKGLPDGLIVLIPVMAFFLFGLALSLGDISTMHEESLQTFPAIAFMQTTSALMQNILFRGLLITALFVKLSNTGSERVRSVFKAAALYLLIYIPLNTLDGTNIGLMQLINTFIVGAELCAAYMYSKNLLSLVLVQGLWQILGSVIGLFSTNDNPQSTLFVLIVWLVIIISILAFAIRFSKRAEPFLLQGEHNHAS